MNCGYRTSVGGFLETDKARIIGLLVESIADAGIENQRSAQIRAWNDQIDILKTALSKVVRSRHEAKDWYLALEYQLPRRQKRPDAVLLADDVILVLEFKLGATNHDASARWQVDEYCLNLRDFHAESAGRPIVPILCASEATSRASPSSVTELSSVYAVHFANRHDLHEVLLAAFARAHRSGTGSIDADRWIDSPYRPTLSIIEAAERLYENHGIREISHNYASNLVATTDMLAATVRETKANRRRVICFVTGVPGAGKTLTGLNVVHDPAIRSAQGPSGIFLSGNGPLVKVVREALVLNRLRAGGRRRECEHEVSTFIQNVHQFLRYHREHPEVAPHEHVVVFDEAQRAWNSAQMKRKQGVEASEASLLLEVMERLDDWAVIIALVGGGQEIFLGEAGLEEWGLAVLSARKRWSIVASPEVVEGGASVAGHRLFASGVPSGIEFRPELLAHLDVSVRSIRAQRLAEWVNALLALDTKSARALVPDSREFPLVITRSLETARWWLRARSGLDVDQRCGLVATSEDQRLRAYGIESSSAFRLDYPFEKWFLAPPSDVRSSFALEVAASEFECQGLELDWVGLCWGGDLTPAVDGATWDYRKFRGARWQRVHGDHERAYVRNRYRVLLTRARLGMVIWVPMGDPGDPTRDPDRFDRVYAFLKAAGVPDLAESGQDEREEIAA